MPCASRPCSSPSAPRLGSGRDAVGPSRPAVPGGHRRRRRECHRAGVHRRGRPRAHPGTPRVAAAAAIVTGIFLALMINDLIAHTPDRPMPRSGSAFRPGAGCSGSRCCRRWCTGSGPFSCRSLPATSWPAGGPRKRPRCWRGSASPKWRSGFATSSRRSKSSIRRGWPSSVLRDPCSCRWCGWASACPSSSSWSGSTSSSTTALRCGTRWDTQKPTRCGSAASPAS